MLCVLIMSINVACNEGDWLIGRYFLKNVYQIFSSAPQASIQMQFRYFPQNWTHLGNVINIWLVKGL